MEISKSALLLFLCVATGIHSVKPVLYPSIAWCADNPIFKKNPHHVQQVKLFSKISVVCPNPVAITTELNQSPSLDHLYENMWIVDKHSFDRCDVNNTTEGNEILLNCNMPYGLKYYNFVFHLYNPQTFAPQFEEGKSYYIISTSNGSKGSLSNRKGGHCKTHNMKIEFYICKSNEICNTTTNSC